MHHARLHARVQRSPALEPPDEPTAEAPTSRDARTPLGDDISNLAAVCPAHHRLLVPHGLLALVGNPNVPDDLELVTASRALPLVPV
jgi:hypothetical protein